MNSHGLKRNGPGDSTRPTPLRSRDHSLIPPRKVVELRSFRGVSMRRHPIRSVADSHEHFRRHLRAFQPKQDNLALEMVKAGKFHHSATAIALYLSRYPRAALHEEKFGYLYKRGEEMLAFGIFRGMDGERYGFIVPISSEASTISNMARYAMNEYKLNGVYVRFLGVEEFSRLLNPMFHFVPAKEKPWHPDAPEEDETLNNSIVSTSKVVESVQKRRGLRDIRQCFNRMVRLFDDTGTEFRLERLETDVQMGEASKIVRMHLGAIGQKGKIVSSSPEDYEGILQPEILSLPSVRAYLGVLNGLPVSVLIGDMTGLESAGMYAAITLRDHDFVGAAINGYDPSTHPRLSALSTFMIYSYIEKLHYEGVKTLDLGGSEIAELNKWKRHLGAEYQPSYWAFLPREHL